MSCWNWICVDIAKSQARFCILLHFMEIAKVLYFTSFFYTDCKNLAVLGGPLQISRFTAGHQRAAG